MKGKNFIRIWIVAVTLTLAACAGIFSERYLFELSEEDSRLTLSRSDHQIILTALEDNSIEVLYKKERVNSFPSFAKQNNLKPVKVNFIQKDDVLVFSTSNLEARFDLSNSQLAFYQQGKHLTTQIDFNRLERGQEFKFSLDNNERLMGGGQRVLGMNRRGNRIPLYNRAHYGYETHSEQMYFSIPAILSDKNYIITYDNAASGFLDLAKTDKDTLSFESVGGRAAYIVTAAKSLPELTENYIKITGTQPMPPRWALGNYASRFGYRSQQEVLDTIEKFIKEDIPVDSIILDLYWFGPDIKGHMGNLEWEKTAFPEPEKMIATLKQKGVKTIPITEPFILSTSKKWYEASSKGVLAKNNAGDPYRFDFYFGNTGLIDIFDSNAQQWFWQTYQGLFSQGVAGTWGDLGEPEVHPDDILHNFSDARVIARGDEVHNIYGHYWAKMVFENQRKLQPNVRPFIMMRSGFAGSQRYGMIPWTGDVNRTWGGLKPQVELSLQMGLLGMAYNHSDLGGFAGGEVFNKELYIRWLQYGVFQPVYRPHAQAHIAPEPVFHDQETKSIIREYIKLRYRLLPYLYTMAYENSTQGTPLMRPLSYLEQSKRDEFENTKSYLWGDAFLVSPVVEPGLTKQIIGLPNGVWFDFWNEAKYSGNQNINFPLSLNTIPVLVRAGAFIPMVEPVQSTKDYSSQKLTLHYYDDKSINASSGKMYEDDGESFDSISSGKHELLSFSSSRSEKNLSIKLSHNGGEYVGRPANRVVELVVHGIEVKPEAVLVEGNGKEFDFDNDKKILKIEFDWNYSELVVDIK